VPRGTAILALSIAALVACGDDEPVIQTQVLNDGSSVRVTDGRVELLASDGRPLWATGAAPLVARTFTETANGPLGIWTFRRSDVTETLFDEVTDVTLSPAGVAVTYRAADATATLRVASGPREDTSAITVEVNGAAVDSITLPTRCDEGGSFHGFGEQYDAADHRGEVLTLFVSEQGVGRGPGAARIIAGDAHTTYFPMPWVFDARGHGLLLLTDHRVEADVCSTDPETAFLEVVSGEPLSAIVFHGPTPLDVVEQLGDEVGRPIRPPDWAFSTWVSIQGGRDAVLAEADALEAAEVPVAALWSQDWTGVRMNIDGGFGVQYRWVEDADHYTELASMIEELHTRGYRFLAYANPFVDQGLDDHWPEMATADLLARDGTGAPYAFIAPNGMSGHPDFTKPETEAFVIAALSDAITRLGIDGWMADFGEWTPLDAQLADGSDPAAYHNRFPALWHRINREAFLAARPDGDYVTFARSGWTGVHAHSMIHWVGDQEASFSVHDGLPTVVAAMTSLGLAGIPFVTLDIGGFSGGPSTKELYLRWVELGAFTPIMRTHEGNARGENWNWDADPETIAHFRRFARIHEALAPELRGLADGAAETGTPMVLHPMLLFPDDVETWPITDQYFLGAGLLVAPVTEEGATSREVYFPAGTWFHVFTGERFDGPMRAPVDAPIGTPAVFSRGEDRGDLRAIE